jgi:hypothetical protein
MRPGIICIQAGLAAFVLLALGVLGSTIVALAFTVPILACGIGLLTAHLSVWRKRVPEPWRGDPAARRRLLTSRDGESFVLMSWLLAGGLPVAVEVALIASHGSPIGLPDRLGLTFVAAPLGLATAPMLISSLIDWHVTTPRISGLVCSPPCMDQGGSRWRAVTESWLVHRWLAAFFVIAGLWLALVALSGVLAYHGTISLLHSGGQSGAHTESVAGVVAALVGLAVAVGGWVSGLIALTAGEYLPALRAGTSRALHPPCSVGEYVAIRLSEGEGLRRLSPRRGNRGVHDSAF